MPQNNTGFTLNGYSYADGKATFNGIDLPGVTSFDFNATQQKSNNYGLGANPVSRSRGNREFTGSIEMDYDTQKALSKISVTNLIKDLPYGVMIFTLEREDGGKEIITMPFFEFMGDGISGSQGDENLTHSIDVIFGAYIKASL